MEVVVLVVAAANSTIKPRAETLCSPATLSACGDMCCRTQHMQTISQLKSAPFIHLCTPKHPKPKAAPPLSCKHVSMPLIAEHFQCRHFPCAIAMCTHFYVCISTSFFPLIAQPVSIPRRFLPKRTPVFSLVPLLPRTYSLRYARIRARIRACAPYLYTLIVPPPPSHIPPPSSPPFPHPISPHPTYP